MGPRKNNAKVPRADDLLGSADIVASGGNDAAVVASGTTGPAANILPASIVAPSHPTPEKDTTPPVPSEADIEEFSRLSGEYHRPTAIQYLHEHGSPRAAAEEWKFGGSSDDDELSRDKSALVAAQPAAGVLDPANANLEQTRALLASAEARIKAMATVEATLRSMLSEAATVDATLRSMLREAGHCIQGLIPSCRADGAPEGIDRCGG